MNRNRKHIVLVGFVLLFGIGIGIGSTFIIKVPEFSKATLKTTQKVFEAGDRIVLDFNLKNGVEALLFLKSSFGSTVISSTEGKFIIPNHFCKRRGVLSYILRQNSKILYKGSVIINAKSNSEIALQTYIGPPSIVAGGKDYTMHIVVPTDVYDNPLPDSTTVTFRHQFLDIEKEKDMYTKNLIAWKNIFSYNSSGKLQLSSEVSNTNSKESSVQIFPALPQDFQIFSSQEHKYADGNQIIEFTTEILKDEFDNLISDGTLVTFIIKNSKGILLQSRGTVVNGQATANMLHPDYKDSWEVKAFIHGVSESNTLHLSFKEVLKDFDVDISSDGRKIEVGPLLSYMKQLIPDGAVVKLEIYKQDRLIDTKVKTSLNGKVKFDLIEGFYSAGNYEFRVIALGVQKVLKNIIVQ
ncbi:hypothetical protein J8281_05460 [Aquimarina sp. U1-2]|uniref:hypothetical protein n=1 Tax=Aquimarina sp. U1-2 TaxID=2823141 RepID=UPI001AECDF26|nr:hypothetical protein [Aquimarina sp. U1-2]MBP2831631.1 hypothetical protein [Aquimarina sp. U1-2]